MNQVEREKNREIDTLREIQSYRDRDDVYGPETQWQCMRFVPLNLYFLRCFKDRQVWPLADIASGEVELTVRVMDEDECWRSEEKLLEAGYDDGRHVQGAQGIYGWVRDEDNDLHGAWHRLAIVPAHLDYIYILKSSSPELAGQGIGTIDDVEELRHAIDAMDEIRRDMVDMFSCTPRKKATEEAKAKKERREAAKKESEAVA